MPNHRRRGLGLVAAGLGGLPFAARGQGAWPGERPIGFIVPFPPGGGTDVMARAMVPHLERHLPGVPTLKELGHDMVVTSPYGLSGPKGMDPGVVRALHDAFKAALFSPANTAVRGQFDMTEEYLDSRDYAEFIARRAEYERAKVQRLAIKLD